MSRPQLAYSTPEFDDGDPLVCLYMQLRPSLWAVVFGLLEQLGQPYSWRQDDPASATVQEVINEINKANAILPFSRCNMISDIKWVPRVPEAWELLCDGDTYDRVDYPELYAKINAVYKIDADTFIVPDLIGRFPLGAATPGAMGGSFEVTPDLTQLTPHHHTYTEVSVTLIDPGVTPTVNTVDDINTADTGDTGGGEPIDITNPFHELVPVIVARLPQAGE